ncbi:MAG: hypothetical protein CMLOHMNK_01308 [Steroidobacteraceae bacterium]|nr:hypothetical protein [Steroidobacteraceae bacterium]
MSPARKFAVVSLAILAAPVLAAAAAAPVIVSTPDQRALAPDVAVGPDGEIAMLWLAKGDPNSAAAQAAEAERAKTGHSHQSSMNLYVAVSKDGGATFSAPVHVNHGDDVWGFAVSRPRIAYGPTGTLHVAYPANEQQAKLGKAILMTHYTRSTDGGQTFEAPRRVSTVTDSDLSGVIHGGFASVAAFGTMGVAPDGSVYIAWIDTRNMKADSATGSVYAAVSRDDGRTFATDRMMVADGVCPCCQLSIAFDAQSRPYLGSRSVTGDNLRSSTVAQADGRGGEFGARVPTGGAPWHLNGCPLKPTVLAVRGSTVYTAAHNGAETPPGVMIATSHDGGASFDKPAPVQPGALVSDAPALALTAHGALIAWHAKVDGPRRVYYRALDARGVYAGPVSALTEGDATSQNPALATRKDGRVQIAWQQDDRIYTTAIAAAP